MEMAILSHFVGYTPRIPPIWAQLGLIRAQMGLIRGVCLLNSLFEPLLEAQIGYLEG